MKQINVLLLLIIISFYCRAQVNIYSALTIPDSLKKDADVVVREEIIKFTIKDINSAKYEVHDVFTILNEQGKNLLNFAEYSDKFEYLDDAEIIVYDDLGIKRNRYSKKEMTTESYGSGLVPSGKLTHFSVNAPSYPFTVEINYTKKYNGLFIYPANYFQNPDHSIQHEIFEVEAPTDLSFRYKILNCNYKPVITTSGDKNLYHWEIKNIPAYKIEKYSGLSSSFQPMVLLAPNKFQLEEYKGDMTSWKNFGTWYNNLCSTTVSLQEDRKAFYQAMVKNAKSDREKAKILYDYLQNNIRYVSIQLGIGGFRPFKAGFVDEKKYGDCKALSNYLKSTLDAVGIKSNLLIIYRDYKPNIVDEKFPMSDFNHVILCIPEATDSIWLECTSTTLPFANLDETTLSRKALMVTDNGGILVNTPASNYKNNTESINTVIEVNEDGGAKVKTAYSVSGENREQLLNGYHDLKEDEKRKFFISNMEWKQPDNLEITNSKDKANPYLLSASMDYEKIYAFNAGNKLFFETRLYPVFDEEIPEYEKRKNDYYFTCPYQLIDTTVYKFPAAYALENMPKSKWVQYAFAQYSCSYSWDAAAHSLTAITLLQIKDRIIKAADYTKLLDFKKQVMADVNEKIVMKKE